MNFGSFPDPPEERGSGPVKEHIYIYYDTITINKRFIDITGSYLADLIKPIWLTFLYILILFHYLFIIYNYLDEVIYERKRRKLFYGIIRSGKNGQCITGTIPGS
jgi:hypothetical protein